MPRYKVTDPETGKSMTLTGDSPPTEQELSDVFAQVHGTPAPSGNAFASVAPGPMSAAGGAPQPSLFERSEPFVRPIIEGGAAALGGVVAGAAATPETLGMATLPAAAAGGALAYAGGKRLADIIYKKDIPTSIPDAALRTGRDIATGAAYEAAGAGVPAAAGLGYSTVKSLGGKVIPQNVPNWLYKSALKPSTKYTPYQINNLLKTGLGEGIPVSRGGAEKLGETIDTVNSQIADTINYSPYKNAPIKAVDIASRLADARGKFSTLDSAPDIAQINAVGKRFLKEYGPATQKTGHGILPSTETTIPAYKVQELKQKTYGVLKDTAYTGELRSATTEARKALARGAKDEIAKVFPEISALNKRDSSLIELDKAIEKAVYGRISNRNVLGLGLRAGNFNPLNIAAEILEAPGVKSRIAISMNKAKRLKPKVGAPAPKTSAAIKTGLIGYGDSK